MRVFMLNKITYLSFSVCLLYTTTLAAQDQLTPGTKPPVNAGTAAKSTGSPSPAKVPVAATVTAPPAGPKESPLYIETTGVVFEMENIVVRPEIGGIVSKIYVTEGQEVKKGDLILELEARQYVIALGQAKATQQKNLALLNLAKITLNRNTIPAQNEAITPLAFEQFQTNVKTAEATAKADKTAVKSAEMNLARTRVISPIDGRLGLFSYGPGTLVSPQDPKNILTDIRTFSPAEIRIQLSPAEFERINKYHPLDSVKVEVALQIDKNQPFDQKNAMTGYLNAMDNHFDPQSGKIQVKAGVPNDDHKLWPGQPVKVRIYAAAKGSGK